MFVTRLVLVVLYSLSLTSFCLTSQASEDKLAGQRDFYQKALTALQKSQTSQYHNLLKKLEDYPLYPYLVYAELATGISLSKRSKIEKFLAEYDGLPVASRLRNSWLEYLRKRDRWQDYLNYYQPGNGTTEQQCYFHLARYRNGERELAVADALELWSQGKSQPDGCDALFGVMIKNNYINEDIAWQRFTRAVLNHQYQLARYLKRFFVSASYKDLVEHYYQVDRSPATVGNYKLFQQHPEEILQVIEHGLTHLAAREARRTLGYWSYYHQTFTFPASSEEKIISAIVKGLYQQNEPKAADTMLRENLALVDYSLIEWRIREALKQLNWDDILTWIQRLPEEVQQDDRWQYWQIRSQLVLQKISEEQAQQQYANLSQKRNFYSFLASDWINNPYALDHEPLAVSDTAVEALDKDPAFKRMRELLHHGELQNARREWRYATRGFTQEQWETAAVWAVRVDWPNSAINAMIMAGYWNDIEIRFPLPYSALFEKYSDRSKVPLHLLYALARQESALSPDATSAAGARGLIQLMPATAQQTARRNQVPYSNSRDLFNPQINIQLGSYYYSEMLEKFNNRILATAAYNAGPHRVTRWLQDSDGKRPFDVWIETIPFNETRNYVQNVLAFSIIYSHHLNIDQRMLSDHEIKTLL